ncbi:putative membrane protein [Octadecabacter antarcticus 307]|uniref:Putative membrane protein n=1 Tax=Octadecabacter antarcticus 307 TaxID=391626 RepID=M9R9B0_9RHOB|nr:hypothetical protein [Octadecabacter antarcticus]AGI69244.1 putative membrane protein [Octadecabacter antarcticus 307]
MSVFAKPMPIIMGALMGLMMMWMLQGALTGESGVTGWALIAFAAAHVAIIVVVLFAVIFAARLSPRSHAWINRLHRTPLHHVSALLGSAVFVAGALHLGVHGLGSV